MNQESSQVVSIISEVTAHAQADPEFCNRYVDNPNEVLAEHGLQIPEGITFKVIRGNPSSFEADADPNTVVLYVPQVEEFVQDESLMAASAASCQGTASTALTIPSCVSSVSTASTNSCS